MINVNSMKGQIKSIFDPLQNSEETDRIRSPGKSDKNGLTPFKH